MSRCGLFFYPLKTLLNDDGFNVNLNRFRTAPESTSDKEAGYQSHKT